MPTKANRGGSGQNGERMMSMAFSTCDATSDPLCCWAWLSPRKVKRAIDKNGFFILLSFAYLSGKSEEAFS
jgi:hypothetical protein